MKRPLQIKCIKLGFGYRGSFPQLFSISKYVATSHQLGHRVISFYIINVKPHAKSHIQNTNLIYQVNISWIYRTINVCRGNQSKFIIILFLVIFHPFLFHTFGHFHFCTCWNKWQYFLIEYCYWMYIVWNVVRSSQTIDYVLLLLCI